MRTRTSGGGRAVIRLAEAAAPHLEALRLGCHNADRIGLDPLRWPRMYARPADREVAAFIAASLSYGNVIQINRSLAGLFPRMGPHPYDFLRGFLPGRDDAVLAGFKHRFNDARDIAALFHVLGQMLRRSGSIEGFWRASQPPGVTDGVTARAGRFISAALALDLAPYFPHGLEAERTNGRPASFVHLFPDVAGTGASKRFFMFLRWVVRPDDGVDLGLWTCLDPSDLEFPVDTHILRIAGYLGATRRKTADARTRREITGFFKRLAPDDPVRYDFSLCRLGILKECPRRGRIECCEPCELRPVCLRHRRMASGKRSFIKST